MKKLREDADYGDYVTISKEIAEKEIANSEDFLKAADSVLAKLLAGRK